jgi:hypothetical protein
VALFLHATPTALATADEVAQRSEVNSHTYLGLGLMAGVVLLIWLIRRLRA